VGGGGCGGSSRGLIKGLRGRLFGLAFVAPVKSGRGGRQLRRIYVWLSAARVAFAWWERCMIWRARTLRRRGGGAPRSPGSSHSGPAAAEASERAQAYVERGGVGA